MSNLSHKTAINLDTIGAAASLLCAIHCALLPFLILFLTVYGLDFAANTLFEAIFVGSSVIIGSFTLVHGYRNHHNRLMPAAIFATGLILIVIGHSFFHSDIHHNETVDPFSVESVLTPVGALLVGSGHFLNRRFSKLFSSRKCCQ